MATIVSFGAQGKIVTLYDEYLKAAYTKGMKKSPVLGILFSSQNFFNISGMALAFWQGSRMYQSTPACVRDLSCVKIANPARWRDRERWKSHYGHLECTCNSWNYRWVGKKT